MEAVQFNPKSKTLSLEKLPIPSELNKDDVLVKVAYAGVCGTDLHVIQGEFPCKDTPIVLGHEFSGVVIGVGSAVKHVKVGDKVAVDPNSGCDVCDHCSGGNYHYCETGGINSTVGIYCNGGWAQYCKAPSSQVYKLPDGITVEQGALTEPLSCVSHGWDRIVPVPVGNKILIQGAGIIGNLWACVLHLQGHRKVVVSEPQEARRNLLQKLDTGYDIIDPVELKKRKQTNPSYGFDLIIDCSGFGPAIEYCLQLLNCGGKLCIFGVAPPETKISVSPYHLYKQEISIIAVNINPFSFPKALGLIESLGSRYLDYNKLGVKTYSLKQYNEAIQELKKGSIAKAIFKVENSN